MPRRETTLTSFNVPLAAPPPSPSSFYPFPNLTWITEMQTCVAGWRRSSRQGKVRGETVQQNRPALPAPDYFMASSSMLNQLPSLSVSSENKEEEEKKKKTLFHCISRQTVCEVTNCFPPCNVLCTLVILGHWTLSPSYPLWCRTPKFVSPPNAANKKIYGNKL